MEAKCYRAMRRAQCIVLKKGKRRFIREKIVPLKIAWLRSPETHKNIGI